MKCVIALTVSALALSLQAAPAKKAGVHTTSNAKAAASKSGVTRSRTRKSRAKRAAAPTYQLHPDPERYQQIQQALADRGYFKGAINGQWNDDSIDALKRFQADQKLDSDGKINALSLIGLGLGPKHDGTSATNLNHLALPDPAAPSELAGPPPAELPSAPPSDLPQSSQ